MMDTTIEIRKATTDDVETLLQISRQTFFDAFAAMNNADDMDIYSKINFTKQKLKEQLENPNSSFYFAILQGNIAGYIKLNTLNAQTELKDEDALEVERIYVLAQYQGRKIGQQMLSYAEFVAKQSFRNYLWLGVFEKNQNAIRFYECNGFKRFRTHYFMLGNDKQTDILMRKDLK